MDPVNSQLVECADRVSLAVTDLLAPDGPGWSTLSVSVIDVGLFTHMEIFDPDQLGQALDLFHRLVG